MSRRTFVRSTPYLSLSSFSRVHRKPAGKPGPLFASTCRLLCFRGVSRGIPSSIQRPKVQNFSVPLSFDRCAGVVCIQAQQCECFTSVQALQGFQPLFQPGVKCVRPAALRHRHDGAAGPRHIDGQAGGCGRAGAAYPRWRWAAGRAARRRRPPAAAPPGTGCRPRPCGGSAPAGRPGPPRSAACSRAPPPQSRGWGPPPA